ncbi:MAG: alpha-glucuronidase family glycosyl hydrolase [Pirellulaceae bacterium]
MRRILLFASLSFMFAALASAAGPRVDIVIGETAPPLEKRAAEDIAADLKKVYDAEVKIATAAPEDAENVIFIGSLETNEQTKKQIAESWPKLSNQGHVLRTIKYQGKPALFIGGGSPVAAYWGAAEYAHHLGIRAMLYGDLSPVFAKPFTLEGFDIMLDSRSDRVWSAMNSDPTGYTSWGLADQKRLLRQLSRLKYNRMRIGVHPWQPFVHFEIDGVKKNTGVLWHGWQFPVDGDTAGRAAFKGAKFFENPDFAGKTTYEQRLDVGQKLLRGLIEESHALGISVDLATSPMEFPREFAPILPGSIPVTEPGNLAVKSLEKRDAMDGLTSHEKLQMNAYKAAYPGIDDSYAESGTQNWASDLIRDWNYTAYTTSRRGFNMSVTRETVCRDLVTPICGEGVDASVLKALEQIQRSGLITEQLDRTFFVLGPDMVMKHYATIAPPPDGWSQVRANYLGAMNDMYRANSRAREGGRSYTLYLARRCEFGYEYMNCVDATRKAGIAKSKKDTAEQRMQLEKAIESMNAACSALAAVARDQSDRGMIVVCNEFGYKALQKELEKLDAE